MPRTSLIVVAVLLGAFGAGQVTMALAIVPAAPVMAPVMAASAPDGRDEPGQPSEPRRPRQAVGDIRPGAGRSGNSDPAASPRPNFERPTPCGAVAAGFAGVQSRSQLQSDRQSGVQSQGRSRSESQSQSAAQSHVAAADHGVLRRARRCQFVRTRLQRMDRPDGAIDAGSAGRLRALLNRLGDRKLPIYFHSPGGSVEGALAIGRLMRARGLTAGVAWTVPQGCDAKQPRDAACDRIKRSGRDLPAQLDTGWTMCFSACVYAIVGAAVRDIAPGARLGIHSSSFTFADRDDRVQPPPRVMRETIEASYARLGRYFTEMGIDPALVAAAREISNDRIRVLTRAEIWRFKIDRRAFVEDGWRLSDPSARAIHKNFVTDRGHADFREALVNLTCGAPDRLRINVAIERVSGDAIGATGFRLVVGGTSRTLTPRRRMTFGASKTEYDVSSVDVPPSFFLSAGGSINVTVATSASSQPSFRPADFAANRQRRG